MLCKMSEFYMVAIISQSERILIYYVIFIGLLRWC